MAQLPVAWPRFIQVLAWRCFLGHVPLGCLLDETGTGWPESTKPASPFCFAVVIARGQQGILELAGTSSKPKGCGDTSWMLAGVKAIHREFQLEKTVINTCRNDFEQDWTLHWGLGHLLELWLAVLCHPSRKSALGVRCALPMCLQPSLEVRCKCSFIFSVALLRRPIFIPILQLENRGTKGSDCL